MIKNSKKKFYFVGGINGSGKSSILKEISQTSGPTVISGSAYFIKWLGLKRGDYKTLRSLPDSLVLRELDKMMKFLIKKPTPNCDSVIFDAHYLNIREGKAVKWIDDWMGLMNGLFLIRTSPRIILQRFHRDLKTTKRDRNLFSRNASYREKIKFLSFCNKKSETLIKWLSKKFKIPYFIIDNNDDIQKAVKKLKNCIEKFEL